MAMKKTYQTRTRRARTGRTTPEKARPDAATAAAEVAMTLPGSVMLSIAELASDLQEALLDFVVGGGMKDPRTSFSRPTRLRWRAPRVATTRTAPHRGAPRE